jgi:hypothetical protein
MLDLCQQSHLEQQRQLREWFALGMHFYAATPMRPHSLELILRAVQCHTLDNNHSVIMDDVKSMIDANGGSGLYYHAYSLND